MSLPPLACLVSVSGYVLTDFEKKFLETAKPLGVTLFGRNIKDPAQLRSLIKSIKETIGSDDVIIAVDQEGGRVRRLAEPDWRSYAAAIEIGALPEGEDFTAARLHAALISRDLAALGINLNFAPSLDLFYPQTSEVLKSRCFSSSELVVKRLGRALACEYIRNSICPCMKHLPGHGRAAVDPHLQLPRINASLRDMERDFAPFRHLRRLPAAMTAHIIVEAVDADRPITQSPRGISELIRKHLGFKGFLISDSIDMRALKGSVTEKALNALRAGCDCVCYTMGREEDLSALADNLPRLDDDAEERLQGILRVIHRQPRTRTDDTNAGQRYDNLMGKIEKYRETYDATAVLNKL